jgi:hypothetical protein
LIAIDFGFVQFSVRDRFSPPEIEFSHFSSCNSLVVAAFVSRQGRIIQLRCPFKITHCPFLASKGLKDPVERHVLLEPSFPYSFRRPCVVASSKFAFYEVFEEVKISVEHNMFHTIVARFKSGIYHMIFSVGAIANVFADLVYFTLNWPHESSLEIVSQPIPDWCILFKLLSEESPALCTKGTRWLITQPMKKSVLGFAHVRIRHQNAY